MLFGAVRFSFAETGFTVGFMDGDNPFALTQQTIQSQLTDLAQGE